MRSTISGRTNKMRITMNHMRYGYTLILLVPKLQYARKSP